MRTEFETSLKRTECSRENVNIDRNERRGIEGKEERQRVGLELQMLLEVLFKENNINLKNHAYTFYI